MTLDSKPSSEGQEVQPKAGITNPTRFAAVLVLLVATPLLLLTGLALGLFFVAPERFNDFLARLPGEAAIRTVMIFAPAALIAIIVLAVLYAAEPKAEEAAPTQPFTPVEGAKEPGRISLVNLSGWFLTGALPALLLLIAVRSAGFLSPDRFESFIERLPASSLFDFLIGSGFPILGILVIVALFVFLTHREAPPDEDRGWMFGAREKLWEAGPARLGVGVVMILGIPLLILSLLALTGFIVRPSRVLDVLIAFPKEVILRLGLLFGPSSLFIVVVLAMLFLVRGSIEGTTSGESGSEAPLPRIDQRIYAVGSWFLVGGLLVACASVFGLVLGMSLLVLR
jgi:hypothetical protein